ncbi:ABC transporter permease subunit [Streptomyces corynorhini]|uniref:ABC transporter permease n=1 Tax=Streptomyces corynorhini TaxID=2282652 RepID=A0A370BBI3_9ACTN|nr:ABC transporter permease subunit [Streptomyces corynorhini]RDG37534.1 ABC transporter permease [Streptomyces corynorhini]
MTTPYQQGPRPGYQQGPHSGPPQPHGHAPGDGSFGYTSPIPARPTHLGDAVASEWTKIRSVRSTMWTLGVMVALILGIGLLTAAAVAATSDDVGNENVLILGFFGVLLATMCVITLGVLVISSEYGTGLIRSTLTACPSRGRVLAAKSLVFSLVVFVVSTVTTLVTGALQVAVLDGRSPTGEEWFRSTVGVSLYLAVLGLLSLAVGGLIRHSAGAITVMIGLVLLPLVMAMFMLSESLTWLREAMFTYSIPAQLSVFYGSDVSLDSVGSGPRGWEPLWIMLVVTAVAMVGAYFSLDRRDV